VSVKTPVSEKELHQTFYRVECPHHLERRARADLNARPTEKTVFSVNPVRAICTDGVVFTNRLTQPTIDTILRIECNFNERILSFRIVAEGAREGTPLEKDHAADPGAVL